MKEPYDVAAQLTLLVVWIDTLLAEETADRQAIAEQASARIKEIATAAADSQAQARRVLDEAIAAYVRDVEDRIDAGTEAAGAEGGEPVPVEEFEAEFGDTAAPPEVPPAVPLETRQQARELPAVRAVYDAMHAGQPGTARDLKVRLLGDACGAAGVDLGPYDDRILAWLAGWEPETCAVIAGLISRAAGL